MARVVRGQLALDVGERLKGLGQKVLLFHEYSGEALLLQKRLVITGLTSQLNQLATLTRSCRAARNSYPNYPALRSALGDAGDLVYDIEKKVYSIQDELLNDGDPDVLGKELLLLGQNLRDVKFVPPESERASLNG